MPLPGNTCQETIHLWFCPLVGLWFCPLVGLWFCPLVGRQPQHWRMVRFSFCGPLAVPPSGRPTPARTWSSLEGHALRLASQRHSHPVDEAYLASGLGSLFHRRDDQERAAIQAESSKILIFQILKGSFFFNRIPVILLPDVRTSFLHMSAYSRRIEREPTQRR
jgi:hypothetical protein